MIAINFTLPFGWWVLVPAFWTVLGLVIAFTMREKPKDFTPLEHWRGLGCMFVFCWLCTAGSAILARYLP